MPDLEQIKVERGKVYGDPKQNHEGIAQMWASLFQPHWQDIKDGKPLPPHVVALCMCLLKINRMRLRYHQDNYDDLRNYLDFAQEMQEEYERNQHETPYQEPPTARTDTHVAGGHPPVGPRAVRDPGADCEACDPAGPEHGEDRRG